MFHSSNSRHPHRARIEINRTESKLSDRKETLETLMSHTRSRRKPSRPFRHLRILRPTLTIAVSGPTWCSAPDIICPSVRLCRQFADINASRFDRRRRRCRRPRALLYSLQRAFNAVNCNVANAMLMSLLTKAVPGRGKFSRRSCL